MNAWIQSLGLDALKPLLTALLLPPVPWLLLTVLGALLLQRRPRLGWCLVWAATALQWAGSTPAGADAASRALLDPPAAIDDPQALLGDETLAQRTVIVVLGGGRAAWDEYDTVQLSPISLERLRYGIWLSRETGLPLGFSGGLSPGSRGGATEAELAERTAAEQFGHPLHWTEGTSRDTHENAVNTIALLRQAPIDRLVLVTHQAHMPRALRHFERARDAAGLDFSVLPAPMAVPARHPGWAVSDYLPSSDGISRTRYVLREWLGLLAGA